MKITGSVEIPIRGATGDILGTVEVPVRKLTHPQCLSLPMKNNGGWIGMDLRMEDGEPVLVCSFTKIEVLRGIEGFKDTPDAVY